MATDGSLGSAAAAFDFDTQAGVMHLLASVRASEIAADKKNELRDLIFLYSNGGHDQSVRHNLEQKLLQYAVPALPQPKAQTQPDAPAAVHEFGTSRPAPAFSADPVQVTAQEQTQTQNTPEQPSAEPTTAPTPPEPTQPAAASEAPDNLPQANAPAKQPEPETPAPASTPEPEAAPAPAEPAPTPEPAPAAPAAESASAHDTPEASLQRIKEIKALVNEKVGNPVNLVDIDNEVGREYMAALLDAMKKVNSGSSAASAIQRLESAYSRVETALQGHESQKPEPAAATPAPTPPIADEPAKSQTTAQSEPQSQPETEPAKPQAAETDSAMPQSTSAVEKFEPVQMDSRPIVPVSQSEQSPAAAPTQAPAAPAATEAAKPAAAPEQPAQPAAAPVAQQPTQPATAPVPPQPTQPPQPAATPESAAQPTSAPKPAAETSAWGPATDTTAADDTDQSRVGATSEEQQVSVPNRYEPASLAQSEAKLRTPQDLPSASAIETSSKAGDPLYTQEVDNGLNQLLSDWALFKKSGLFGTGPKGIEHPLYLKIKDLQIPLLLAGRFEGATQEIKQSITDYMNGWRYEQGIIYEQGEAFDHYLRRVIRHILDLQKKN